MIKIFYLKDYTHMEKIKNRMLETGWIKSRLHGFYSGSDWFKDDKYITFSSIGLDRVMIYLK